MGTTERHQRPAELTAGLLLLGGLGLFAGLAGMFVMGASPLSAVATMAGALVAMLATAALLGSASARATLVAVLVPLFGLVVEQRIGWLAVALVVGTVLLVASPRARAWYR